MPEYWFASSTEEFPPGEMVEHAKAAEEAGFDGLGVSDHFGPWFPDGMATQAWGPWERSEERPPSPSAPASPP